MSGREDKAIDRDGAVEAAMALARQRHREGKSARWLFDRIEAIEGQGGGSFFSEAEVWEMVDAF